MNKKILFAIFTCNRFYYLKNCIESILECHDLDRIDVLICDNCSIEDGYEEYLNNIANNKNITVKRFEDRTRNELYRAMNWTIEYAKKCK
ncbi:MAG: glycosyltransferase family A protein, partial [Candidatus Asgardarchaeia archaeon]